MTIEQAYYEKMRNEWFNGRYPFWNYEVAIRLPNCRRIILRQWKQDKRKGLVK